MVPSPGDFAARRLRPLPASGVRSRVSCERVKGARIADSPLTRRLRCAPSPTSPASGARRSSRACRTHLPRSHGEPFVVVPAKAGTHTPCRSFERRCSMTFTQQLRAVVTGPGSRFACPGRQWWIFDSSFKQPIAFSRRKNARVLLYVLPSETSEGAGNAGRSMRPQPRMQK
jgi:hypothetical protein